MKKDKFWRELSKESLKRAWTKEDEIWDKIYKKDDSKKNKKGQLLEKPFIFIFEVVLIGLIFIFGFYLISNFLKQSNCTELGIFANDLKNNVERYYNFDIGSSTEINLRIPGKINYVCFYNNDEALDREVLNKIDKNLYDVLQNLDFNIVFLPKNYCAKSFFKIEKLRAKENPTCVLNTGNIRLSIENKGEFVEIGK